MATYIRTVDGKLQIEIEPGSPVTMGPNIPTEQAVISAAAAAAAAAEAAEAAAEQAMSSTPEGYADLVGSVAETYSSLDTYAAGDYVLHESTLYQAAVDIDTAEEWTADHWKAVTVGGELESVQGVVTERVIPDRDLIPLAVGTLLNYMNTAGTLSSSANWRCFLFRMADIRSFSRIETYGSATNQMQIGFYSSEDTFDSTTYISGIKYTQTSGKQVTTEITIPAGAKAALIANRSTSGTDVVIRGIDSGVLEKVATDPWEKYDGKFQLIGYSAVLNELGYLINTEQMYEYVAKSGFDAIKGDIRITSDNALVMCHDAGFTVDQDGKITSFDASDYTPIRSLTLAQVQELVFATQTAAGDDMTVPTFDTYVKICAKYGKICFPTLRDDYMTDVLPAFWETLDKYHMTGNTIINSLTLATLLLIRSTNKNIPVCYTVNVQNAALNNTMISDVEKLGNAALGYFTSNGSGTSVEDVNTRLARDATALSILKASGVRLLAAIAAAKHLDTFLSAGFNGCQTIEEWGD